MPTEPPVQILIAEPDDFPHDALAELSKVGNVHLGRSASGPLALEFVEFDVVFTRLAARIEPVPLASTSRHRILVSPTTGLDHVDLDWCRNNEIEVLSLAGDTEFLRTIRGTAEHTLALTLALLRRVIDAVDSVREGHWRRDEFRGREISGSTVGIVGMGRIGTMMAEIYHSLGASVTGFDPEPVVFPPMARRVNHLHDLLSRSNIVTLHASYRSGQAPVLASGEFDAIRPGAILINTARGGLIDERALVAALESGKLGGAAVDVVVGEPEVSRSLLVRASRHLPNLIITPHVGGNTYESRERVEVRMAQRVTQILGQVPDSKSAGTC